MDDNTADILTKDGVTIFKKLMENVPDNELFYGACLECITKHFLGAEQHYDELIAKAMNKKDYLTVGAAMEARTVLRRLRLATWKIRLAKGQEYVNPGA
jgi:hypothetical protein